MAADFQGGEGFYAREKKGVWVKNKKRGWLLWAGQLALGGRGGVHGPRIGKVQGSRHGFI